MRPKQEVEFTCPQCGMKWIEMQSPDEDWYKLGTKQTLCNKCGLAAIKEIRKNWQENTDGCSDI